MKRTNPDDTIAAVSTPPGDGGIGIVRLSGPDAVGIVQRMFVSSSGRSLLEKGRVFHGEIREGDATLDEVLVHVMRAPRSYTCEDVVEINGHGGAVLLNAVLELVLRLGARLAEPGEFTKRAFLNGRIDLTQAEAVIDRIRAQTRAGLQAASAAGRGRLSEAIYRVCESLRGVKAQLEAAVDFSDQDVSDPDFSELRVRLESTRDLMRKLLDTSETGRLYREGASVAIAGRPNVGKSSLFNALLRESRAIVTARAGTTRDLIEEVVAIRGIPVRLTDMAGLRDTDDEVEQLGVSAARRAISGAAAILFVVDASVEISEDDQRLGAECIGTGSPVIRVWNKVDLRAAPATNALDDGFAGEVSVSAKTGAGLDRLEDEMFLLLTGGARIAPDQGLITRLHQKESLRRALDAVERMFEKFGASAEFLAIEVDEALDALGEITGETTPDEVLERIFAEFCLGK